MIFIFLFKLEAELQLLVSVILASQCKSVHSVFIIMDDLICYFASLKKEKKKKEKEAIGKILYTCLVHNVTTPAD